MVVDQNIPQPQKGEVQIRVHYSTINPYDRMMYKVNSNNGFVLGCDGCGIVSQAGVGVD
jgi:NADPH:quinone reductase-like Zn-dependent oxidoreductase